jgi:hypothetical protein
MNRIFRHLYASLASLFILLAAASCNLPTKEPIRTGIPHAETATLRRPTRTEKPAPEETPIPTVTPTPLPPPATPTSTITPTATISPTATIDISGWLNIIGTWSGCVSSASAGVPSAALACAGPSGMFATLYVKPTCVIGQWCGNLVTAAFESEYVLLKLTLLGIQGSKVWMHGTSSSPIYASANTDLSIEREGGKVRVTEQAGQQLILILPPGCDQVIQANTTIGCYEHIP